MNKEISLTQRRQSLKQKLFLDYFKKSGIIAASADVAGIARQLVYYWRKNSPSFARRMLEAENEAHDNLNAFVLKAICEKARKGNQQAQKHIRKVCGEKKLNAVMRGQTLTMKDVEA